MRGLMMPVLAASAWSNAFLKKVSGCCIRSNAGDATQCLRSSALTSASANMAAALLTICTVCVRKWRGGGS